MLASLYSLPKLIDSAQDCYNQAPSLSQACTATTGTPVNTVQYNKFIRVETKATIVGNSGIVQAYLYCVFDD